MDSIKGITTLHGKAQEIIIDHMQFTVMPLYHPAAILYKPGWRTALEEDFLTMKNIIESKGVHNSVPAFDQKPVPKQKNATKPLSEFL